MPVLARVLLLLGAVGAGEAAQAATARCHVIYGGEEWTIEATPTAAPYDVQGHKIGRYFEFKLVFAELPTGGTYLRAYTYGVTSGDPVLIHQATWRPPFATGADGYGISGFQYVYEPSKSSELQYWCEVLP